MPQSLLTGRQIALIHAAARELAIDTDDYRRLLERVTGKRSAKDLDQGELDQVLAEFERLGWRRPASPLGDLGDAERPGMASPRQLAKLMTLWRRYTGRADDKALGRWLEPHFHVAHPRFLEPDLAAKVIGVLQRMVDDKQRKRSASRGGSTGAHPTPSADR